MHARLGRRSPTHMHTCSPTHFTQGQYQKLQRRFCSVTGGECTKAPLQLFPPPLPYYHPPSIALRQSLSPSLCPHLSLSRPQGAEDTTVHCRQRYRGTCYAWAPLLVFFRLWVHATHRTFHNYAPQLQVKVKSVTLVPKHTRQLFMPKSQADTCKAMEGNGRYFSGS